MGALECAHFGPQGDEVSSRSGGRSGLAAMGAGCAAAPRLSAHAENPAHLGHPGNPGSNSGTIVDTSGGTIAPGHAER